jgi:uncharacterized protein (TIGR00369 family)
VTDTSPPLPEPRVNAVARRNQALLGYRVTSRDNGEVHAEWTPTEQIGNPMGFVHGGFVGVMVDELAGIAVATALVVAGAFPTATMHVEYVRGIRLGETHSCVGRVVRIGRGLSFAEAEIRDGQGRLCSRGQCTFALVLGEDNGAALGLTRV